MLYKEYLCLYDMFTSCVLLNHPTEVSSRERIGRKPHRPLVRGGTSSLGCRKPCPGLGAASPPPPWTQWAFRLNSLYMYSTHEWCLQRNAFTGADRLLRDQPYSEQRGVIVHDVSHKQWLCSTALGGSLVARTRWTIHFTCSISAQHHGSFMITWHHLPKPPGCQPEAAETMPCPNKHKSESP